MKAKEVRGIEARFIELLTGAPGTKEDKQDFFRDQLKIAIPRPNYETMWDQLVESIGRVGAAEAVFDYVIASAEDRLRELLSNVREGEEVNLRAREPSIIRHIFFENGNFRPIGQRLYDYLEVHDQWWGLPRVAPTHELGRREIEKPVAEPKVNFDYDVALSFAGEQRAFVDRVAKALDRNGILYFYDAREETRMWGKDLANFLDELFREKARYCVMFLSRDYVRKAWPTWEGRAAIARAVIEKHREYVLPVRFDDAEFPGLRPTIKYLDATALSPEQIAEHIVAKLSNENVTTSVSQSRSTVEQTRPGRASSMKDVEKIAVDFVMSKRPDWKVEVESVKQSGDGWTVKGAISKRETSWRMRSITTEKWTIEIKKNEVVDYEFTPGAGFAIT